MKQHITPKQAKELGESLFYNLFEDVLNERIVHREDWYKFHHKKLDIGKMIEILDISTLATDFRKDFVVQEWIVEIMLVMDNYECKSKELCDALFKAVKDILN